MRNNTGGKMNRTNTYPGKCLVCKRPVQAQRGYLLPRDDVLDQTLVSSLRAKWITLCSTPQCIAAAIGDDAAGVVGKREIQADGTVVMQWDEEAKPLQRAFATWNGKNWVASPLYRDRDLVLRIAAKLKLDVAPEFAAYEDPKPIRLAVERGRAAGARDYQLEGIRWCAYRGTTYGAPEGFEDKKPGAILADQMGTGKSLQLLFALHDDEAMVVGCPANAKAVWEREALKWRPDRFDKITICEGSESFRWPANPRELVIINYDVLPLAPRQIKAERQELLGKRHGVKPDPRATTKAARAGVVGLLKTLYKTVDKIVKGLGTATPKLSHFLEDPAYKKVSRALYLNRRALRRNATRKPCGKPPCRVFAVFDEAHYLQNNSSRRTVAARYLAKQVDRLIPATGTPVEDDPMKLWGLLQSGRCNPFSFTAFKEQFSAFKAEYALDFRRHPTPKGSTARGAVIVQPGTTEILSRVLLRRTKEQVLAELPDKIYSEIPVPLKPALLKELDEFTAENIEQLLSGELPKFDRMSRIRKLLALASIDTMLREVEGCELAGIPLIVFSAHLAPINKLKGRKGWAVITGDVSARARGEIEDAFQAGKLLGVAGTRAMAESMTLTYASTLLQVDPFWERKYNKQAEDRAHRLGQKSVVQIIRLVPDHPLPRHTADLLAGKDRFFADTLHSSADYTPTAQTASPEDDATWAARVAARRAENLARERAAADRAARKRERELAEISKRDVSPKVSEQRAQVRAARLGDDVALHRGASVGVVREALGYMLAVCDGAVEKDDQGFNRPDGCVARWLAPGVQAGSEYATASAAAILRHYPRQLSKRFPTLFADVI